MALDTFRRIDIILDTANDRVDWQTPLDANTGEYNSRNLRVQLTNGGVVEPQKADLYFGFRHVETGNNGVYPMKRVDANQGIYEVYYPSEMLSAAGSVICAIKIVEDSDGRHINKTANFTVDVKKSVIDDNMEIAENSLRVFDKVLLDVQVNGRKIIVVEDTMKEILREYKDLQTWLKNNIVKQSQIDELTRQNAEIAFNASKIDHLAKTAPLLDIFGNLYVLSKPIELKNKEENLTNMITSEKVIQGSAINSLYGWDKKPIIKIQGSGILLGVNVNMIHYIKAEYEIQYNYNSHDYTGSWSFDRKGTDFFRSEDELHNNIYLRADGHILARTVISTDKSSQHEFKYSSLYGAAVIRNAKFDDILNYASATKPYDTNQNEKILFTTPKSEGMLSKTDLVGIQFEKELSIELDVSRYSNIDLNDKHERRDSRYEVKKYTNIHLCRAYNLIGLCAIIFPNE